jgi:hypothetical protein
MTERSATTWESIMKITAGLLISLDGVVDAPDQWHFAYLNDEMGAVVDAVAGRRRLRPRAQGA